MICNLEVVIRSTNLRLWVFNARTRNTQPQIKLDWDIKNLREKNEKINIANDKLRLEIAELSQASTDLRRVNGELQQEYRRCQKAHAEKKAKIMMLHERDMQRLQLKTASTKVVERKVAINAERDAARRQKEQDAADAEYEEIMAQIAIHQAEHDRLKPLFIRKYVGVFAWRVRSCYTYPSPFPLSPPLHTTASAHAGTARQPSRTCGRKLRSIFRSRHRHLKAGERVKRSPRFQCRLCARGNRGRPPLAFARGLRRRHP